MKLKQLIGPFPNQEEIKLDLENVVYMQIGIEHPHSIPLSEIEFFNPKPASKLEDFNWPIIVTINEEYANMNDSTRDETIQRFFVFSEKDILEFRYNQANIHLKIKPNSDPYIIINLAYKTAD